MSPSHSVARFFFHQGKVEASGALCHTEDFLPGFTPNIICRYPSTGNSTDLTILSAHYDSRGSFGRIRAPGGDDDGSGSGHLLGIANIIGKTNVTLQKALDSRLFRGRRARLVWESRLCHQTAQGARLGIDQHSGRYVGVPCPIRTHAAWSSRVYWDPGSKLAGRQLVSSLLTRVGRRKDCCLL